ncbi:cell division septation protein DedD [Treponema rectale]|uniref:Cell division septation protein DedD n=1 Tax=Treponema rectale TaxID=744512 RepID=A0A840SJK7_9SPIR|nr:SPOR domain-containing protein [Treponema rectale]MBB5219552.1 cell division septation protein DedD [Treponema rectale]
MEQKKTLWIVLAAGIFLLFVIGAALILYAPQTKKSAETGYSNGSDSIYVAPSVPSSEPPSSFNDETTEFTGSEQGAFPYDSEIADRVESETSDSAMPENLMTENLTVYASGTTNIYENTKEGTEGVTANNEAAQRIIRETGNKRTVPEKTVLPPENETESTDIQFGAARVSSKAGNSAASVGTASSETVQPSKNTVKNTQQASKPAAVSSKTTETAVKSGSTKEEKQADRFWIQIASYTSKKTADEARKLLYDKGFQCEVFTWRNKEDTLYFRVRVGPYTTKSEAEYWKAEITKIAEFAASGAYVTNSSIGK